MAHPFTSKLRCIGSVCEHPPRPKSCYCALRVLVDEDQLGVAHTPAKSYIYTPSTAYICAAVRDTYLFSYTLHTHAALVDFHKRLCPNTRIIKNITNTGQQCCKKLNEPLLADPSITSLSEGNRKKDLGLVICILVHTTYTTYAVLTR